MTAQAPIVDLSTMKLVIWDLDDTLWSGIVSEGEPVRLPTREAHVRAMADAGLVQSVASNNDADRARAHLRALGLDGLFVFSQFGWGPKSRMVQKILDLVHIRPEQVLFIDDNPRLRFEVRDRCRVAVADPVEIDVLDLDVLHRSDDGHARLGHYRTMERRHAIYSQSRAPSVHEFLRTCDVRVELLGAEPFRARILELTERANQLNFTGSRLDGPAFDDLVADPAIDVSAVVVTDRFGSYGTSGFVAVDRTTHTLVHFVFSCRVLNMGVEQFVFAHIGRPDLRRLPGHRAASLRDPEVVDWIRVGRQAPSAMAGPTQEQQPGGVDVLLVGGCDLETMTTYLSTDRRIEATWHLPTTVDGMACAAQSSLLLLDQSLSDRADHLDAIPWLANWRLPAPIDAFELVVLSLWADVASTTYRHIDDGVLVPGAGAPEGFDLEGYVVAPPLSPDEIDQRIRAVRQQLRPTARLAVVNVPEVMTDGMLDERVAEINDALVSLHEEGEIELVDVREVVSGPDDLAGDGVATHYARPVYAQLAARLRSLVE